MLLYIWTTLCLLSFASSGSVLQSNQYMDSIFINSLPNTVRRNNLDPAKLQNITQVYRHKVVITNVNVNSDYHNGNLTGLSRAVREKNCSQTAFVRGQFAINCTMILNKLHLFYQGVLHFGKMPKMNFKVEAPITAVPIYYQVVSNNNGRNPYVSDFRLLNGVFFNPIFSGMGPTAPLGVEKNLKANFTQAATFYVINTINTQFKNSFQQSFVNTWMPL